ncbi:MAG: hypothetical protein M1819_001360 [Sarea resinae]|nr:MAG: hypothetical protein M1819_001360 [Sarea resinae]
MDPSFFPDTVNLPELPDLHPELTTTISPTTSEEIAEVKRQKALRRPGSKEWTMELVSNTGQMISRSASGRISLPGRSKKSPKVSPKKPPKEPPVRIPRRPRTPPPDPTPRLKKDVEGVLNYHLAQQETLANRVHYLNECMDLDIIVMNRLQEETARRREARYVEDRIQSFFDCKKLLRKNIQWHINEAHRLAPLIGIDPAKFSFNRKQSKRVQFASDDSVDGYDDRGEGGIPDALGGPSTPTAACPSICGESTYRFREGPATYDGASSPVLQGEGSSSGYDGVSPFMAGRGSPSASRGASSPVQRKFSPILRTNSPWYAGYDPVPERHSPEHGKALNARNKRRSGSSLASETQTPPRYR